MKLLHIFIATLVAMMFSVSAFARQENLQISNFTRSNLSIRVNGICSPELDTISMYSIKTFSDATFKHVCRDNIAPCHMEIYSDESCQGELIETVNFYSLRNFVASFQHSSRIRGGITNGPNGYDLFFVED